jgi:hypothetical protein
MAAAVAGQAESLVTWNAKDFDCGFTRKHAIKIMDSDEYLYALYDDFHDRCSQRLQGSPPASIDRP